MNDQWGDDYQFKHWYGVMLVIPIHIGLISIPIIPLVILIFSFDLGYFSDIKNMQLPDWFFFFSFGLYISYMFICINFIGKILKKYHIIIPSIKENK